MSEHSIKIAKASRRAGRVRGRISSSSTRPRLSVSVSNLHVSAQIIDDSVGKTIAYSTSMGQKVSANLSERAKWVGTDIAKKAKEAKIKQVAYDRGSRLYHGRVKQLAEAARAGGLEF